MPQPRHRHHGPKPDRRRALELLADYDLEFCAEGGARKACI
jgi:hypothetical protein